MVVYATKYSYQPAQIEIAAQALQFNYFRGPMYGFIRFILFLFPAESVHYFAMNQLKWLASIGWVRKWMQRHFAGPFAIQPVQVGSLLFPNPIGLGAGFDKNALYLKELSMLGFGFVEIGTVTPRAQEGNPIPRLFRLREDKALINRMGFNNDGADVVAERLKKFRLQARENPSGKAKMIVGGNIGKNKSTPNEYAYADYDICFRRLAPWVDYLVVNVSSPNTPGLRALQDKKSLHQILTHLQGLREETGHWVPIFLKIAPDLSPEQLQDIAHLAMEISLDGLVATNTTTDRSCLSDAGKIRAAEAGEGGLSGIPLRQKSYEVLTTLRKLLGPDIPIIASGGIFTRQDVEERMRMGASLIQVWTAFVYEGPSLVGKLLTRR
jgi:dihydroorotate dehydrogenase